jgi:hypothetical protein
VEVVRHLLLLLLLEGPVDPHLLPKQQALVDGVQRGLRAAHVCRAARRGGEAEQAVQKEESK